MRIPKRHENAGLADCFTVRIVSAIAEAKNAEPIQLTPPLFDVVDPDALEQFLLSGDETTLVSFLHGNWQVEVRGDGTIDVTEPPDGE